MTSEKKAWMTEGNVAFKFSLNSTSRQSNNKEVSSKVTSSKIAHLLYTTHYGWSNCSSGDEELEFEEAEREAAGAVAEFHQLKGRFPLNMDADLKNLERIANFQSVKGLMVVECLFEIGWHHFLKGALFSWLMKSFQNYRVIFCCRMFISVFHLIEKMFTSCGLPLSLLIWKKLLHSWHRKWIKLIN